jgi:hypothetical protein
MRILLSYDDRQLDTDELATIVEAAVRSLADAGKLSVTEIVDKEGEFEPLEVDGV